MKTYERTVKYKKVDGSTETVKYHYESKYGENYLMPEDKRFKSKSEMDEYIVENDSGSLFSKIIKASEKEI